MRNKETFVRMFFGLSLILALGVAPGLSVYAQQAAQNQPTPRVGVAAEQTLMASDEKPQQQPSAEGEPLPLSDAEMEKVEGGLFGIHINIKLPSFNLNIKSNNKSYNRCR